MQVFVVAVSVALIDAGDVPDHGIPVIRVIRRAPPIPTASAAASGSQRRTPRDSALAGCSSDSVRSSPMRSSSCRQVWQVAT